LSRALSKPDLCNQLYEELRRRESSVPTVDETNKSALAGDCSIDH
jgi:hypothetical protein